MNFRAAVQRQFSLELSLQRESGKTIQYFGEYSARYAIPVEKDNRCYFLYRQKVTKELGSQRYLASLNFRGLNLLTTKPVAARNKFFTPTSAIPVHECGQNQSSVPGAPSSTVLNYSRSIYGRLQPHSLPATGRDAARQGEVRTTPR